MLFGINEVHTPLLFYFQILINDITTYPSSNLGVIFIRNEHQAKLTNWRENKENSTY